MSVARQRGAALLMAMLTVALVATFAATALWQQWRAVEVEAAERSRVQSAWVLVGALDWARLILREDARATTIDHLAEPWAVPLQESRLSTFLAAERGVSQVGDEEGLPEVFLSGRIIDLQSRMNVTSLVNEGQLLDKPMQNFIRLFALLGLPQQELMTMAEKLRLSSQKNLEGDTDVPLKPQRFEQLIWLGLSPATLQVLAPHVTVLPVLAGKTTINLNTASAEVITASIHDLGMAEAERLVQARARKALSKVEEAAQILEREGQLTAGDFDVKTNYFEVQGRLRVEGNIVNERSLVQRNGSAVTTLWRERAGGELLR